MSKVENFKHFLMEYKAYDKFCNNILDQRGNSFRDITVDRKYFRSIIDSELTWSQTPEGSHFWSSLSELWNDGLSAGKLYKPEYKSIW